MQSETNVLEETEKDCWIQFLDYVKKRCSTTEYHNWFSPVKLVKVDPEKVIVEVPNIFVQEYILENYKKDLLLFLPQKNAQEPAIEFVISSSTAPIAPKKSAPIAEKKSKEFNTLYTFENFIEGPSNQFVKSAAMGVASRPGKTYNPLFIHGGVGLGKTHLLHGIGHYVRNHHRKLRVQCITTEAFINDLVDHLKNKSIDKMKKFYRNLDLLLVDDIQFLQNRLNFEDEISNTFETLINQNKQIVITSDKPPADLKLSERLIARMEWGLVAHVGAPDLETRVAIVQHKAEQRNVTLTNEIAFFIAEHIYINVRQLEGAINRLAAYGTLMKLPLTLDTVSQILSELFQKNPLRRVSVDLIIDSVAKVCNVHTHEIKKGGRTKEIAQARQVAMYLSKELVQDSLMKIALAFGGKTHSTLLYAWKKITEEIKKNETLKRQVDLVMKHIEVSAH